jgi:membrane protein
LKSTQMNSKEFFALFPATWASFSEDKAPRLAAALSYFTLFSIAPMLIIAIGVAGQVFGPEAAQGQIKAQLEGNLGETAATAVQELLQNAYQNDSSKPILATIIGGVLALFAASGLFGALQDSLNTIWGIAPRPDLGIMGTLRARVVSFAMVLVIGFLLLVSLALTAAVSLMTDQLSGIIGNSVWIAQIANLLLGFLVTMLLFAAIYKVLPDVRIKWRDVWVGAAATSFLFLIGRYALVWYLGRPGTESAYGSAGALVVLLIWVNYASQILFFGAEFTKVYANKFGSKILPSRHAIAVTPEARARQGLASIQNHSPVASTKGQSPQQALALANRTPKMTPEEARKEFEWTLSVVAGAVLAGMWIMRRRSKD